MPNTITKGMIADKNNEAKRKIPSQNETKDENVAYGADDFLPTPCHLEDVYKKIGGLGTYQIITFICVGVTSFYCTDSVGINFVGGPLDHWCFVEHLTNFSHKQQQHIAIQEVDGEYSSCEMFDLDYSSYSLRDLVNWNRSQETLNATTVSCASWVYDQSVFVSTITKRFDLVCGDSWLVSLVSTGLMAGFLVGSVVSGHISDRYGRKRTLCGGIILKVVTGYLTTFSVHYIMTLTANFLIGLTYGFISLPAFVLVLELVESRWRNILGVCFQLCFSLGFVGWSGCAYFIRDDRNLQLVFAIVQVLMLVNIKTLDESPRWLIVKGRYDEADIILRKIARVNAAYLPDNFSSRNIEILQEDTSNRSFLDLMRFPKMRMRTLVIDFYWFTVTLIYYALSLNTNALSGDVFLNTFLSGLVEVPANLLCIVFMAWPVTGRRLTSSGAMIVAGTASLISVALILNDIGTAHTVLATVAKGFATAAFSSIYVYSSELFPTEVRTIGMGTASMCGRVSGLAAPYVGGPLSDIWAPLPSVVYGCVGLLSGLLTLLLPETLGVPMFKTIEEAEVMGKLPLPINVLEVKSQEEEKKEPKEKTSYSNQAFDDVESIRL